MRRGFCWLAEMNCKAPAAIRVGGRISACRQQPVHRCGNCHEDVCDGCSKSVRGERLCNDCIRNRKQGHK